MTSKFSWLGTFSSFHPRTVAYYTAASARAFQLLAWFWFHSPNSWFCFDSTVPALGFIFTVPAVGLVWLYGPSSSFGFSLVSRYQQLVWFWFGFRVPKVGLVFASMPRVIFMQLVQYLITLKPHIWRHLYSR